MRMQWEKDTLAFRDGPVARRNCQLHDYVLAVYVPMQVALTSGIGVSPATPNALLLPALDRDLNRLAMLVK